MTNTNTPRSDAYAAAAAAWAADPIHKVADAYDDWIAASYEEDASAYAEADAAYATAKSLKN